MKPQYIQKQKNILINRISNSPKHCFTPHDPNPVNEDTEGEKERIVKKNYKIQKSDFSLDCRKNPDFCYLLHSAFIYWYNRIERIMKVFVR